MATEAKATSNSLGAFIKGFVSALKVVLTMAFVLAFSLAVMAATYPIIAVIVIGRLAADWMFPDTTISDIEAFLKSRFVKFVCPSNLFTFAFDLVPSFLSDWFSDEELEEDWRDGWDKDWELN